MSKAPKTAKPAEPIAVTASVEVPAEVTASAALDAELDALLEEGPAPAVEAAPTKRPAPVVLMADDANEVAAAIAAAIPKKDQAPTSVPAVVSVGVKGPPLSARTLAEMELGRKTISGY